MIVAAGRVVADGGDLVPGHVVVERDRVARVAEGLPSGADYTFPDGTLVPGFIDLQVNGGAGVDLLDCAPADVERLCRYLAGTGTSAFLPTLITAPPDRISRALSVLRQSRPAGATVLGVHLEGPVLNPARRGAHDSRVLASAGDPSVQALYDAARPDLRLVTLAPELPGALDLIARLTAQGVVVSLGHTDATYAQAAEAFRRGARMVTHLFNGMRGLHHREPGIIGAAFEDAHAVCGLIADGVHVHPAMIRLAHGILGARRIALVTDAIAAAGMPPGEYRLADRAVTVQVGDAPRLPDGTLAGSTLRMDEAVRNLVSWGIPLRDALQSASFVPARVLGLTDRGALAAGARADVCVLGADGRATLTVVGGGVVFRGPGG